MDHRSYGETKNCKGCRYWSEMIARAGGGFPLSAMCLAADGPNSGQYSTANQTCEKWKSGELGAIDEPGTEWTDQSYDDALKELLSNSGDGE